MTLTIDLTPEEPRRIEAAQKKGIDVTAMMTGVIAGLPETTETGSRNGIETASQDRGAERVAQVKSSGANMPLLASP